MKIVWQYLYPFLKGVFLITSGYLILLLGILYYPDLCGLLGGIEGAARAARWVPLVFLVFVIIWAGWFVVKGIKLIIGSAQGALDILINYIKKKRIKGAGGKR